MNVLNKLVLLFLGVIAVKTLYNLYCFIMVRKYYAKYKEYVEGSKDWFIRKNKQKIIKLFKQAGIEDTSQPHTELAGYGMVRSSSFSVFKNLSILQNDIVSIINGDFQESIDIYKQRIIESFNPIFWLETLIFLPRMILSYLGADSKSVIIKFFQIVWWLIGAVSLLIGIIFNQEFINWFSNSLETLN